MIKRQQQANVQCENCQFIGHVKDWYSGWVTLVLYFLFPPIIFYEIGRLLFTKPTEQCPNCGKLTLVPIDIVQYTTHQQHVLNRKTTLLKYYIVILFIIWLVLVGAYGIIIFKKS